MKTHKIEMCYIINNGKPFFHYCAVQFPSHKFLVGELNYMIFNRLSIQFSNPSLNAFASP